MHRYFIEVSYLGTRYSGFQVQQNANTIQAEIEAALLVILGERIGLTGSSRTDAGVHAVQNFFHLDTITPLQQSERAGSLKKLEYKLNALLPGDISVRQIIQVPLTAHCRFDAKSRLYYYQIHRHPDPFLKDRSYYFPYKLHTEILNETASLVMNYQDFTSFSKRNTQVKNFLCSIQTSRWLQCDSRLFYRVEANRFLRGMVRGLVATMLRAGRGKITVPQFRDIIESKDCTKAVFSVPAQGLYLKKVNFDPQIFVQDS